MREEGIEFGKTYPSDYFEKSLSRKRNTMEFGLAISEIRRELEKDGFYLSGRGQKGDQFVILPAEDNVSVMQGYNRRALDALKRGVILGTNTPLQLLDSENRKRHEALLERMAVRTILIQRTQSVVDTLRKHQPKLLKKAE